MKVIINKWLPVGKKFYAINLFGIIFAKGNCNDITLNHEKIHSKQMIELLIITFYIIYSLEWLIILMVTRDAYRAYKNISFEKEAYANQTDMSYLKKRKPYSFITYFSR